MNNEKTRVTVDIYGTNYKLVGNSSPGYMKAVASYVNDQMVTISTGFPRLDYPRIAVLAAVHMAEELLRLREQWDQAQKSQQHDQNLADNFRKLEEKYTLATADLQQEREANSQLRAELQQLRTAHTEGLAAQDESKSMIKDLSEQIHKLTDENKQWSELSQEGDAIHDKYRKLQLEYAKLQREYDEWTQIVDENAPEH